MTFLSLMFVSEKKESWSVDTDRESDVKDSWLCMYAGRLGAFPSDDEIDKDKHVLIQK